MGRFGEEPSAQPDGTLHQVNGHIFGIWKDEVTYTLEAGDFNNVSRTTVRATKIEESKAIYLVLKSDLKPGVREDQRKFYPAFITVSEFTPNPLEVLHTDKLGFYFIYNNKKYLVNFGNLTIFLPAGNTRKKTKQQPSLPPITFQLEA